MESVETDEIEEKEKIGWDIVGITDEDSSVIVNHKMNQESMTTEIDNIGGEELEILTTDTTVNEAPVNRPSHLLRAERELLLFCMEDKSFRKRSGNLDWDKVENVFANKADNEKIFTRDRKRLRSTSKKIHVRDGVTEVTQVSSTITKCTAQDSETEEPDQLERDQGAYSACEESVQVAGHDVVEESIPDQGSNTGRDSQCVTGQSNEALSASSPTCSTEPKRLVGILSELEREFVRNYGKQCVTRGKNIDNNCMLKAYRTAFPGYNRDGDILKKYWINWKKDSPAFKDFIKSLSK